MSSSKFSTLLLVYHLLLVFLSGSHLGKLTTSVSFILNFMFTILMYIKQPYINLSLFRSKLFLKYSYHIFSVTLTLILLKLSFLSIFIVFKTSRVPFTFIKFSKLILGFTFNNCYPLLISLHFVPFPNILHSTSFR